MLTCIYIYMNRTYIVPFHCIKKNWKTQGMGSFHFRPLHSGGQWQNLSRLACFGGLWEQLLEACLGSAPAIFRWKRTCCSPLWFDHRGQVDHIISVFWYCNILHWSLKIFNMDYKQDNNILHIYIYYAIVSVAITHVKNTKTGKYKSRRGRRGGFKWIGRSNVYRDSEEGQRGPLLL